MSRSKSILFFLIIIVLLTGLCGCDSEFEAAREQIVENEFNRFISTPQITDFEVRNVEIDYVGSSSYSSFMDVVGVVRNKTGKTVSSLTLTLYLYKNGSVILTEKDYVFDLGPYDENSFEFMVDRVKLLTCDEYMVKVTNVF